MRAVKIYYAHPVSLFGSAQEERDKEMLRQLGFHVINPSDEEKVQHIPPMKGKR